MKRAFGRIGMMACAVGAVLGCTPTPDQPSAIGSPQIQLDQMSVRGPYKVIVASYNKDAPKDRASLALSAGVRSIAEQGGPFHELVLTVAEGMVAPTTAQLRRLSWISGVDTNVTHVQPIAITRYSVLHMGTTADRPPLVLPFLDRRLVVPFNPTRLGSPILSDNFRSSDAVPWGIDDAKGTAVYDTFGDSGSGVNVAIIDGGVDCSNPDLSIAGGMDWMPDSLGDCSDGILGKEGGTYYGHGTLVAGVLAAQVNNYGVIGMAPAVHLYSLRVCDSSCPNPYIVDALEWSISHGMQVVNLSLAACTVFSSDTSISRAITDAWNHGILVVVGASADHAGCAMSPFDTATGATAVAAMDSTYAYYDSASYGTGVVKLPGLCRHLTRLVSYQSEVFDETESTEVYDRVQGGGVAAGAPG